RLAGALAPLAQARVSERQVRALLVDHALFDGAIDEVGGAIDAGAPADVELRLAEGRRALVLDDLDARARADGAVADLDLADAAHIEPHRRVVLERVATGGGLRIAEHHANLLAQLID